LTGSILGCGVEWNVVSRTFSCFMTVSGSDKTSSGLPLNARNVGKYVSTEKK
jgi:hypothetical protein